MTDAHVRVYSVALPCCLFDLACFFLSSFFTSVTCTVHIIQNYYGIVFHAVGKHDDCECCISTGTYNEGLKKNVLIQIKVTFYNIGKR